MEHCDRRIAEVETAARGERKQLTDTIASLEHDRAEQAAMTRASAVRFEEIRDELRREREVGCLLNDLCNEITYLPTC